MREFDIVVFGATGYTGRLVAAYLARHGGEGLRWALAGRDRGKLEGIRSSLGSLASPPDILVADASDSKALAALAARTTVVATTVGPFAKHGLPLVGACAAAGTHYADITGEVPFMRRSIDTYDDAAKASGACIVHTCGFDSVPSDLGVFLAAQAMKSRHDRHLGHVRFVCLKASGGFSGGTIASMLNMVDEAAKDRGLAKLLSDPYALSPLRTAEPLAMRDGLKPAYDGHLGKWLVPFLMGPVNTRVVRRTNALSGYSYGRGFAYEEFLATGRGPQGLAGALAVSGGIGGFLVAASNPLLRSGLAKVLPAAGEGPTAEERERGSFTILVHAESDPAEGPKETVSVTVKGVQDPGYGETAKMLSEAALTLASAGERPSGVTTPALGLGMPYVDRLRAAGMTWSVAE
jgi:short subunit dehydrogenase-like uncharacterized protein